LNYFRNIALVKGKHKACLEIYIGADEKWICNFIVVKNKNKEQIEIAEEHIGLTSDEMLKKISKSKFPLCLVINGKGIISKKIHVAHDDANNESIIQQVLPNAKHGDFYLRKYSATDNNAFVSLIRKSLLEGVLDLLSKNKISVVEVFWGPFTVNSVIPLMGITNGEILTEHYKFTIENSFITEFIPTEDNQISQGKLSIGDEKLEVQSLISFGTLINHFYINKAENTSEIAVVINAENNFVYSKLFAKTLQYSLILVFIVLLVNFFLFDYYNRKQQDLFSQVTKFNDLLTNQDTLKKTLESKRDLLEKSGLLESSKISFYSDRIASVVNEGITLTKLEVNPLKDIVGQDKDETGYEFTNETIELTGTASNSTYLNEWIKDMKVFNWVKDITIKNYNRDNSLKPASFTILAKIDSK
jgi:hypothetical protein